MINFFTESLPHYSTNELIIFFGAMILGDNEFVYDVVRERLWVVAKRLSQDGVISLIFFFLTISPSVLYT